MNKLILGIRVVLNDVATDLQLLVEESLSRNLHTNSQPRLITHGDLKKQMKLPRGVATHGEDIHYDSGIDESDDTEEIYHDGSEEESLTADNSIGDNYSEDNGELINSGFTDSICAHKGVIRTEFEENRNMYVQRCLLGGLYYVPCNLYDNRSDSGHTSTLN